MDYFKIVLSILVISGHTPLSSFEPLNILIGRGLAHITVPCFFIINGYYIYPVLQDKNRFHQYLKRMLSLYVVWTIIYFSFIIIQFGFSPYLVILNLLMGYFHLWYVAALMLAVIMLFYTRKISPDKMLICAIVIYYIGYVCVRLLTGTHFLEFAGYRLFRNFFFLGFPFVFMGYYLSIRKDFFLVLKKKLLLSIILLGILLLLVEVVFMFKFVTLGEKFLLTDFYFSLTFLCPALFLYIIKISKFGFIDEFISKLSSAIYFVHVFVLKLLDIVSQNTMPKSSFFLAYLFIILIFSVCVFELNKRIKILL